jgi:hypothetical protein
VTHNICTKLGAKKNPRKLNYFSNKKNSYNWMDADENCNNQFVFFWLEWEKTNKNIVLRISSNFLFHLFYFCLLIIICKLLSRIYQWSRMKSEWVKWSRIVCVFERVEKSLLIFPEECADEPLSQHSHAALCGVVFFLRKGRRRHHTQRVGVGGWRLNCCNCATCAGKMPPGAATHFAFIKNWSHFNLANEEWKSQRRR